MRKSRHYIKFQLDFLLVMQMIQPLLFRKRYEPCAVCGREMKHKHKPMDHWGINGYLCGDCHIDKMKEFAEDERTERCELCGNKLDPKNVYESLKGMNLKSRICADCYERKRIETEKKLENCITCGKKLGFLRYNPKHEWNLDGQLCRKCWDFHNNKRH